MNSARRVGVGGADKSCGNPGHSEVPSQVKSSQVAGNTTVPGTGKKTPGGAGTHTGHTGHTGARGHTGHTDEPHNHPPKTNDTPARKPRPTQQPGQPQEQLQARSRPLPAADSEEAAPSEPDPASTRSQSSSPRLLEGGRRNEGARGRCVTAGGAARAPNELKTREAETGVSDGRGEADLSKKTPQGGAGSECRVTE